MLLLHEKCRRIFYKEIVLEFKMYSSTFFNKVYFTLQDCALLQGKEPGRDHVPLEIFRNMIRSNWL